MIIYGWGHFNRREHSLVRDNCRACGRAGYLRSYTSSKFFTLYFIPVIPLGHEKVVQECPHCKQAFGLSLGKWRKLKRVELPKALAAYEARPHDAEAARQLLGACISAQDAATLRRVGPQIHAAFARDAAVLGHLAGAYSYLCLDREADAVYLDAVALSPDGPIAAEANAHLELQRLPKPTPPNRLLQSLPVFIVPAILLFVALGYVQKAVTGGLDSAYLVNGLEEPYSILVNGERVTLRPHRPVSTRHLELGRNEIAPADGAAFLEAQTIDIAVPIWDRMFSRTTAVVNPDRAAVIAWEKTGYAYPKAPEAGHEFKVRTGEVVHVHQDVDFVFAEFPASIQVPSDGAVSYRTRLADLGQLPSSQLIATIANQAGREALSGYVRARLRGGVDDTTMIHLGAGVMPREEFLAIAATRLEVRPVRIEWHRAYQSLLEGTEEGRALEATYRAAVAREPENSTMLYLLGRIVDDPAESVATFERAVRMDVPSAYAANALGYHHLFEGEFQRAVGWSSEALRLDPGNESFKSVRLAALYGAGSYAIAEQEAGDPLANAEQPLAAFTAHLYRMARIKGAEVVPAEINRFVAHVKSHEGMSRDEEAWARGHLEAAAALATRDRARFVACTASMSAPVVKLQNALVAGELDRALHLAEEVECGAGDRLLLYVLLQRAGRAQEASGQLVRAVDQLKAGAGDALRWAGWLSGAEAPSLAMAAHTCPEMDNHTVYLTALAEKFPAVSDALLVRAEQLRWFDSYVTLALDASQRR